MLECWGSAVVSIYFGSVTCTVISVGPASSPAAFVSRIRHGYENHSWSISVFPLSSQRHWFRYGHRTKAQPVRLILLELLVPTRQILLVFIQCSFFPPSLVVEFLMFSCAYKCKE